MYVNIPYIDPMGMMVLVFANHHETSRLDECPEFLVACHLLQKHLKIDHGDL